MISLLRTSKFANVFIHIRVAANFFQKTLQFEKKQHFILCFTSVP